MILPLGLSILITHSNVSELEKKNVDDVDGGGNFVPLSFEHCSCVSLFLLLPDLCPV